ncbi:unnamed protein product [Schistosoma guineensis]|nr:unnamed protein product [Schistosoma guineensis]
MAYPFSQHANILSLASAVIRDSVIGDKKRTLSNLKSYQQAALRSSKILVKEVENKLKEYGVLEPPINWDVIGRPLEDALSYKNDNKTLIEVASLIETFLFMVKPPDEWLPYIRADISSTEDSQPIEQSKASSANTYSLLGIEWNIWRDIELGGGCGVSDRHKKPTNPNNHRGVLTTLSVSSPRSWSRNFGALWRSTWYWLRSSENNAQIYPHSDSKTSLNFFADSPVTISEKKLEQSRVKFARLTYTPICTGCSKCWEKKLMSYKESGVEVNIKKSSSLSGRIFGFSLSSNNNKSNIDEVKSIEIQQQIKAKSSIDNPACGELKELIVEKASGFTITPEGVSLCMAVNL